MDLDTDPSRRPEDPSGAAPRDGDAPTSPTPTPFALRVGRTAAVAFVLGFGLWWALPRFVPGLVGDRVFLREEFFHPTTYSVGGLTMGRWTVGARTVDCSRLERPAAEAGRNLLANPTLDGPCGWGFAPSLGGADDDGALRVAGDAYAFQDVRLGPLAGLVDGGEARLFVSGVFFVSGSERPRIIVEAHAGNEYDRTPILDQVLDPPRDHGRWPANASVALPPGTRGLRVILRSAGDSGATWCDEITAVVRRSFAPE